MVRAVCVADRANTHHRHDSGIGKLRRKALHRVLGEAAEHERSLDRLQIVGVVLALEEVDRSVAQAGTRRLAGCANACFGSHVLFPGLRSMALISSISAMGVTPAIGSLENSPMRNASAPASLPSRYTGLPLMPATTPVYSAFRARQAHQDDVALGAIGVFQNSQNFHSHGFGLGSLENGVGDAMHAGVNRADRNGVELLGRRNLGLNSGPLKTRKREGTLAKKARLMNLPWSRDSSANLISSDFACRMQLAERERKAS